MNDNRLSPAQIGELCDTLVASTGLQFHIADRDDDTYHNRLETFELKLFFNLYEGRLRITSDIRTDLRDFKPYGSKCPSISVAETKTALQIVKDITRRMLPELKEILREAETRQAKHNVERLIALQTANRIARIFQTQATQHTSGYGPSNEYVIRGGPGRFEIHPDCVVIERLRVEPHVAITIAETLAGLGVLNDSD